MLPGFENIPGLTKRASKQYDRFIGSLRQHHRYEENAVPSARIEKALGLSGSEIRALRHLAWEDGILIASGSKGYYWSDRYEDAQKTQDHITARWQALGHNKELLDNILDRLQMEDAEQRQKSLFSKEEVKS